MNGIDSVIRKNESKGRATGFDNNPNNPKRVPEPRAEPRPPKPKRHLSAKAQLKEARRQKNKLRAQDEKEREKEMDRRIEAMNEGLERSRMARHDVGRPIFVEPDERRPKKFSRETYTATRARKTHQKIKQQVKTAMLEKRKVQAEGARIAEQRAQENLERMRREARRAPAPAPAPAQEARRTPTPAEVEAQKDREKIRARAKAEVESRQRLRKQTGASASSGASGPSVKTLQQIWDALEPLYHRQTMAPDDDYYYHMLAHGGPRPWKNYNAMTPAQKQEALTRLRKIYAKYIRD
jgi:hypothetical protein